MRQDDQGGQPGGGVGSNNGGPAVPGWAFRSWGGGMTPTTIAHLFGISDRTVFRWLDWPVPLPHFCWRHAPTGRRSHIHISAGNLAAWLRRTGAHIDHNISPDAEQRMIAYVAAVTGGAA